MSGLPDGVSLAEPYELGEGAVLRGPLRAGPGLLVSPRALIGGPAQHRAGGPGRIELGRDVQVRECATIHQGSSAGTGRTRVGDRVLVMAYAHLGHDVELDDDVTVANGAQLGGHVRVGREAVLGARAALHQFVTVGEGAMVAAGALVSGDVPPFCLVAGDRARLVGPNRPALLRRFGAASVAPYRRALRALLPGGLGALEEDAEPVRILRAFLADPLRRRPICGWRRR